MRLLIAALAALCLVATAAEAKTLVVGGPLKLGSGFGYDAGEIEDLNARMAAVQNILNATGSTYKVIPMNQMKTEWARTGVVTWNFGQQGAYTESFDAVIDVMFCRKNTGSPLFSAYRPDSLTLAPKLPQVPVLLLPTLDGANALGVDPSQKPLFAASCSTGVLSTVDGFVNGGSGTGSHDEEGSEYSPVSNQYYFMGVNAGHATLSYAAANAAKGLTPLLAQATAQAWKYSINLDVPTAWSVPLAQSQSPDTAIVWIMRHNLQTATAKPIIYALVSAAVGDGSEGLALAKQDIDYQALMVGMAALDSASGGKVFDNKSKLPLKVAITVDGLCSRSDRLNSGGINPADTTRFYQTVDSLAAANIPVVFGVNIDSIASYPRDLQRVKDASRLFRFSPQGRIGIDTTQAIENGILDDTGSLNGGVSNGGGATIFRPIDQFRKYRNQSMAIGPVRTTAADTSLYALSVYALARMDSLVPGRVSATAMPMDDDWSPYNWRAQQADPAHGVTQDSILAAYAKAGYRAIRFNANWMNYRPERSPTNPRGMVFTQGNYRTAVSGLNINLLGHQGGSTYGSVFMDVVADSTNNPPSFDPSPGLAWRQSRAFWKGVFRSGFSGQVTGSVASDENSTVLAFNPCRIYKVSAQELAGISSVDYKTMIRHGWWGVRSVWAPIQIMNQVAGRSIMQVAYPEDIRP